MTSMCGLCKLATYLCGPHGALPLWAQGLLISVAAVGVTALVWVAIQLCEHLWYQGSL